MKKWSEQMEEILIRNFIYLKALTILERVGGPFSEAYLKGIKDAIRIFLNASKQEINTLEKKIDSRTWDGDKTSKEVKKVMNLRLEAESGNKKIYKHLDKWLRREMDLSQIRCKMSAIR